MRLGVYADIAYRRDEAGTLSTQQAFVKFVTSLPPRVDELVLFGRLDPAPGRTHYPLPQGDIRFVPLPHYPRVTALGAQLRALRQTQRVFLDELAYLDAVWVFGPHPIALVLALSARWRRTPLFLGVRQDYARYITARLPSWKWFWAVGVAHVLEWAFRALSREAPTVTVGDELARKYRRGKAPVLSTGFSLVGARDVVTEEDALRRDWGTGEWRILTVGRLDAEKNPLLLLDVLSRLREEEPRWRLTVVGDGPLRHALEQRASEVGVADAVSFAGYVEQGERLWRHYRRHHVFLHVSLTEGFPQVVFEAHAAGTPLVATAVGGVAAAVRSTGGALLIPPADVSAAVGAVKRISEDPELRRKLVLQGLSNAGTETMEHQLDRIAAFFADGLSGRYDRLERSAIR
jgi:glycosyltransferase involved in cell wall biosynthesis